MMSMNDITKSKIFMSHGRSNDVPIAIYFTEMVRKSTPMSVLTSKIKSLIVIVTLSVFLAKFVLTAKFETMVQIKVSLVSTMVCS